jgi:glycosyltransferase involved in cell wall biosynthesis
MTVEEMMTISNGISVVVPAYNAEKSIERAIRSALQCKEVERIIVVDDGSVDNTAGVATAVDPRVEVIRQPNSGAFVARQRGVEAAQSEFLVLLDADDQLGERRLRIATDGSFRRSSRQYCWAVREYFSNGGHRSRSARAWSYRCNQLN